MLKQKGKIIIGLTGVICSGKSSALQMLGALGAYTISADALVDAILKKENADKKAIADKIFNNEKERKKLEARLHPLVYKEAEKLIKKAKQNIIVFEVPLMFEAGWEKYFDVTLTISVDAKTQSARGKNKNNFEARRDAQLSNAEKVFLADVVIDNNKSLKDLETKVTDFFKNIKKPVIASGGAKQSTL